MTAQVARPVTRLAVTVAAGALAVGAGLVGAGVARTPARHHAPAISRGGQLYAAECARCHGVQPGGGEPRTPPAPPLGVAGHTWRHTDAELAAIVARGTGGGMPGFAERLGPGEISDVLAYVRSHWPTSIRAYQAGLSADSGQVLATLLRDPAWSFPAQCSPPPAMAEGL